MRRFRREMSSSSGLHGADMLRIGAGVMVLAILFISMDRARDPRNWQWLTGVGNSSPVAEKSKTPATSQTPKKMPEKQLATKPKNKPADSKPAASNWDGLTDEDREQFETAQEEFEAVSDGNLKLAKEEMEAYDRLVYWVENQTFAQLWQRGRKNPSYSYLYDGAEDRRGQIFSLDVTVRLVRDAGKNRYGVPLHEAWSVTNQSRDRLYDLIVLDFPREILQEKPIQEKARFAGYFLKLQGYYPALRKEGQPLEIAPLLIGRLDWEPAVAPTSDAAVPKDGTRGILIAAMVVILGLLAGLFLLVRRQFGHYASPPASLLKPTVVGAVSLDEWLEGPFDEEPEESRDLREESWEDTQDLR